MLCTRHSLCWVSSHSLTPFRSLFQCRPALSGGLPSQSARNCKAHAQLLSLLCFIYFSSTYLLLICYIFYILVLCVVLSSPIQCKLHKSMDLGHFCSCYISGTKALPGSLAHK